MPRLEGNDSSTAPIRLAIVNDYQLVIDGIAAMLRPYADRVVVVELDSNAKVIRDVDVVLYDTFAQTQGSHLPPVDALVSTGSPRLVVYSWNISQSLVQETERAGASGLVSKGLSAEELVAAIEDVHHGEQIRLADPDVEVEVLAGRWPGDEHGLSARESEVLALICQGLGNQEIADRAYLSINTVKTYIRSTYRKVNVTTRSQALLWGISEGFQPDYNRRTLEPR